MCKLLLLPVPWSCLHHVGYTMGKPCAMTKLLAMMLLSCHLLILKVNSSREPLKLRVIEVTYRCP